MALNYLRLRGFADLFRFLLIFQENCILYVVKAKPDQTRFIPKDASKLRRNLWKIILSDHFENVVLFIVILNTVCLGMEVCELSTNFIFGKQKK